jgi:hypothetical protein
MVDVTGMLTVLDDEQTSEGPPANAKVRRQTALPVNDQVTRTRQINPSGGADDYPRAVLFMLLEPVRGKVEFGEALVIFAGAAVEEARRCGKLRPAVSTTARACVTQLI